MSDVVRVPHDVAKYCRAAGKVLDAHKNRLNALHELWADEDPDPENGYFWHVQIAHPETTQLRKDLTQIAEFLNWLAAFSNDCGEVSE